LLLFLYDEIILTQKTFSFSLGGSRQLSGIEHAGFPSPAFTLILILSHFFLFDKTKKEFLFF